MKNLSEKKYILMFVLSVFVCVTTLIGGSYALIQRVLVGTNTYSMKTGNFLVEFAESQEITLSNQVPVYDNIGMSTGEEMSFSVTNNGNYNASYSIRIEETSTEGLGEVVRYAIDYGDGYSYENVHALVNNQYIIQNKSLAKAGTDSYKLRFWLDIDASEEYISKVFSAKVVVETTQEEYKYGVNVLDAIYQQEDKEGLVAVNTNGTLAGETDEIREYRFSGKNVNNYVWFNCDTGFTKGSEHCEKWRIIGSFYNTYENGIGTYRVLKIVRDEVLTSTQKYNSNTGNYANFSESSIKTYLNSEYYANDYYNTFSTNTKNLIMKSKWNIGTALNNEVSATNYETEQNKVDYANVALINASDFGYASDSSLWETKLNKENTFTSENNWLYKDNYMVLNTLDLRNTNMYYVSSSGLTQGTTTTSYNVRPTLYLKPDVSIINGYGTEEEPYEISIKYEMTYGNKTTLKTSVAGVTYDLNGGTGNVQNTYLGDSITNVIPEKVGYTFLGWSTNQNATFTEYEIGDIYNGIPTTLYAVYEARVNFMDTFPTTITNNKTNISEVHFMNITEEELTELTAEKIDLTYDKTGKVTGWFEEDKTDATKSILYVGSEGTTFLNTGSSLFSGWTNLKTITFANVNTSKVTTMSYMFYNCSSLTSLDISDWDVSGVTTMYQTFLNCSSLTSLDISDWDVSGVTTMSYMFYNCSSLTSLDLSAWDVSAITTMTYMFHNCSSLTSLDISDWDVSGVTTMSYMFYNCSSLTSLDISDWDVSGVTTMSYMFYNCSSLTSLDLSAWDVSGVTTMYYMFYNCSSLTSLDLSAWDVSGVTTMYYMFYNCSSLTSLDLSAWDVSGVTTMYYMFYNCSSLTTIYANTDWQAVATNLTSSNLMFYSCTKLVGKVAYSSSKTDITMANLDGYFTKKEA